MAERISEAVEERPAPAAAPLFAIGVLAAEAAPPIFCLLYDRRDEGETSSRSCGGEEEEAAAPLPAEAGCPLIKSLRLAEGVAPANDEGNKDGKGSVDIEEEVEEEEEEPGIARTASRFRLRELPDALPTEKDEKEEDEDDAFGCG